MIPMPMFVLPSMDPNFNMMNPNQMMMPLPIVGPHLNSISHTNFPNQQQFPMDPNGNFYNIPMMNNNFIPQNFPPMQNNFNQNPNNLQNNPNNLQNNPNNLQNNPNNLLNNPNNLQKPDSQIPNLDFFN